MPYQVTSNLNFLAEAIAAAGTALLLGVAAMSSSQQDPAAASAPFDARAGVASRTLAQGEPRVIEVVAKKFAFEPARIEVTEGERIRLVVTSADGVHGVGIKKFKVEKLVPRGGEAVTMDFVASAVGTFPIVCSEYCGKGHDEMKGALIVIVRK